MEVNDVRRNFRRLYNSSTALFFSSPMVRVIATLLPLSAELLFRNVAPSILFEYNLNT